MKNLLLLAIFVFASTAAAQTEKPKQLPKTISAGVVNGKAISLPKPVYPDDARRLRIAGVVAVKVVIDENGMVVSAEAVSGPENASLRQAAEAAAMQAKFSPTLLSGQPVKVSGVITYNFVGKTNEEILRIMGIATVLTIGRELASDLDKFKIIFDEPDMFKDAPAEFPEFAKVFSDLAGLEKMPNDKRTEALNGSLFSIRAKLNESDKWQFEVGQNFGELMGQLMLTMNYGGGASEFAKLDESALKLKLNKIKQLLLSAPPDFPADVMEKFKDLTSLAARDNLVSPKNMAEFAQKLIALFETISLNPTK